MTALHLAISPAAGVGGPGAAETSPNAAQKSLLKPLAWPVVVLAKGVQHAVVTVIREDIELQRRITRAISPYHRAQDYHRAELAAITSQWEQKGSLKYLDREGSYGTAERTAERVRSEARATNDRAQAATAAVEQAPSGVIVLDRAPCQVTAMLFEARAAAQRSRAETFSHAMTERSSAFFLAKIEGTLRLALADLKIAVARGNREDADFAHETIEMLTADREALRAGRIACGWSEDGDEAPEA